MLASSMIPTRSKLHEFCTRVHRTQDRCKRGTRMTPTMVVEGCVVALPDSKQVQHSFLFHHYRCNAMFRSLQQMIMHL
jgi:hypothetical protein